MNTLIMTIHILACVLLVIVVLLQAGKDGGLGMAGGGSSQTVFGSSGGANFFTRFTSVTAAIFMLTSIGLTVIKSGNKRSVFDNMAATPGAAVPAPAAATPAPPASDAKAPATK